MMQTFFSQKTEEEHKLEEEAKPFNFFYYRIADTVYKKTQHDGRNVIYSEEFELKTLRKYSIDSVQFEGNLRLGTVSYILNLDKLSKYKVDYVINVKDSTKIILGYNCVYIEIIETKTLPPDRSLNQEINRF